MRLRRFATGGVAFLGLVAGVTGAGGTVSAIGEETTFAFSQAGEPLKHPGDLIETTMIGHGAYDIDAAGLPTGSANGTIVYHESRLIGNDLQLRLSVIEAAPGHNEGSALLRVKVEKSNDASCPVGGTGAVAVIRQGDEAKIGIRICGFIYFYAGKVGKNSRINVRFSQPQRCLTALPSCPRPSSSPSLTTTAAATTTPVEPTTLTLTVNGRSDTATTAKPTNDDPTPLIVPYGTSLNIKVTANAPMPNGWKIEAHHNGDVLSKGNGDYAVVCSAKTGASSCTVTRPPPTNAAAADFDDVVYANILAPTYLARSVQIFVYYRK